MRRAPGGAASASARLKSARPPFRPSSAADLAPTLRRALDVAGPSLVEVPIDYRENLRLTEHLGALDPEV